MLKILTKENPVLINTAEDVKHFDKKLQKLIKEMEQTLKNTSDPVGVGLAAPQIGLPLRLFLARPNEKINPEVFINPVITHVGTEQSQDIEKPKRKKAKSLLEGCLSLPNIWGNVKRPNKLTLAYQDETGRKHKEIFTGFMATIVQHEIDHLNGILFTKRVLDQNQQLYRSYKNEKGEDEFEEIKI